MRAVHGRATVESLSPYSVMTFPLLGGVFSVHSREALHALGMENQQICIYNNTRYSIRCRCTTGSDVVGGIRQLAAAVFTCADAVLLLITAWAVLLVARC